MFNRNRPTSPVAIALIPCALLAFTSVPAAHAQNQLWLRQFGTEWGDVARAIAPAADGVFIAGTHRGGSPLEYDTFLAKYSEAGNPSWSVRIGRSRANDWAEALASDGAGGVYLIGYQYRSSTDVFIWRYNGSGSLAWVRQFGTTGDDRAYAAALDGAGGVFVGGSTSGSLGGPFAGSNVDAWLARYDDAGSRVWIRQLGTSSNEVLYGATPDGAGGVFVCGQTSGRLGGALFGRTDAFVARYDSAGNQLWLRQFGTSGFEIAYAIAPDGAGGVFVCGDTDTSFGGSYAGGSSDAWLGRFDGSGTRLWLKQFGTDGRDTALAVASDGADGVFVTGNTAGGLVAPLIGNVDAFLLRYDANGNQIGGKHIGQPASVYDGLAIAVVDADRIYAAGSGGGDAWIARYGEQWCYTDCDQSTGNGVLDIFDFLCFQNSFVNAEPYACDCDTTTGPLVCDIFDFLCFQNAFVGGCP